MEHLRLSGRLQRQRHPPRLPITDHLLPDVPDHPVLAITQADPHQARPPRERSAPGRAHCRRFAGSRGATYGEAAPDRLSLRIALPPDDAWKRARSAQFPAALPTAPDEDAMNFTFTSCCPPAPRARRLPR